MTSSQLRKALQSMPDVARMSTTAIAQRFGVSQSMASRVKRSLSLTKSTVVKGLDGRRIKVRKIGRGRKGASVIAIGEKEILLKARALLKAKAGEKREKIIARRTRIVAEIEAANEINNLAHRVKRNELTADEFEAEIRRRGPAFMELAIAGSKFFAAYAAEYMT